MRWRKEKPVISPHGQNVQHADELIDRLEQYTRDQAVLLERLRAMIAPDKEKS